MDSSNVLDLQPSTDLRRVIFGAIFGGIGGLVLVVAVVIGGEGGPAGVVVGLLFLTVGLAVGFGRKGLIVDRGRDTITTWWGVFVPFSRKELELGEPGHVEVSREVRGSGKSRTTVFPVTLVEKGIVASQELFAPQSYVHSRHIAERLAGFLEISLHDSSSGALVIREADTLDEPLRDRLLREQGTVPTPSPTPPGRLRATRDGDEVTCVLPPPGIGLKHVLGLVMVLVIPLFVFGTMAGEDVPLPIRGFYVLFGAVPALLVLPSLARALLGRDQVRMSARGVALRSWFGLRPIQRIPAEELEELTMVAASTEGFMNAARGGSVVARSDERTLVFGKNLTGEELRWLHDTICRELVPTAFGYRDKPGAARLTS